MDIRSPIAEAALARYREVLDRQFEIKPESIHEVCGGWSARAFQVSAGERRFFLKVYDSTLSSVIPWIERIDSYIHVLAYLARTEALRGQVAVPIPTIDGGYKAQRDHEVFLLFDFIEGDTPGFGKLTRAQKCELAGILARLHTLSIQLPVSMDGLGEDISLWFAGALREFLETDAPGEPSLAMRPHKETLMTAIDRTIQLRDRVRAGATALSLCHTDAHGGNVIQSERLVLVDWEGLCVGPAEADLFMFVDDPDWDAFLAAYCAARPGYALDHAMLRFYQYRRVIEDIWYDLLRLLNESPQEAERTEIYEQLERIVELTGQLLDMDA